MRVFNTVPEAEAALGRTLFGAMSVDSLTDARDTVRAMIGPEYEGEYSVADTVVAVFVAVRRRSVTHSTWWRLALASGIRLCASRKRAAPRSRPQSVSARRVIV